MSIPHTSSSGFFEARYRQKADPWDFASSRYELHRYDATIAALAHRRYRRAFEPGCSIGVLTERLAGICDEVEALDFSATAIATARNRCAHLPNAHISCASLADRMPIEGFDLIVLSEVGYYLNLEEWKSTVTRMLSPMMPEGTVLAVHWLGISADHQISGEQVHQVLEANSLLCLQHAERNEGFRLDRWVRV